jgi:hypothetical protein
MRELRDPVRAPAQPRRQSERETEWYVRDMSECYELLSALDVIVNQADRFIRELCAETNVSTAGVPLCPYGTARYKRVSDASGQLNYIEVELTNGPNRFTGRPVWERKRGRWQICGRHSRTVAR